MPRSQTGIIRGWDHRCRCSSRGRAKRRTSSKSDRDFPENHHLRVRFQARGDRGGGWDLRCRCGSPMRSLHTILAAFMCLQPHEYVGPPMFDIVARSEIYRWNGIICTRKSEFNDDDLKKMNFNAKAINIILSALGLDEYSRTLAVQLKDVQHFVTVSVVGAAVHKVTSDDDNSENDSSSSSRSSGKENANNLCFMAIYRSRGNTCITGRTWLEINIASSSAFKVWNTLYVCENPGCLFIATNRDAVEHLTELINKSGQVLDVWLLQCVDQLKKSLL
nr:phosphoglycolate phosphatase 2 isoform X3 [Ipomoea batatas]